MELYKQIKKDIRNTAIKLIVCIGVGIFVPDYFQLSYNNTDNIDTSTRSGMSLHTDYKTGCQYLSAGGGLYPRVDNTGIHICNTQEKKM